MSGFEPIELLRVLETHDVSYVIVGGFAAWMHGAPIVTTDIDIVYAEDEANIARLVDALQSIDAVYRHQHGRRIEPTVAGLSSTEGAGHHLLATRFGHLDVLRSVSETTYDALHHDAVYYDIDGLRVPCATLQRIIALKEAAGRPKDIAALPMLRGALEDDGED